MCLNFQLDQSPHKGGAFLLPPGPGIESQTPVQIGLTVKFSVAKNITTILYVYGSGMENVSNNGKNRKYICQFPDLVTSIKSDNAETKT